MRRRGCLARLLLVVAVAFAVLPVGAAQADITIGQVGGQSGFSARCFGVLADTSSSYAVPVADGVVTSFSIQTGAGNNGALVVFLILRPVGGGNYALVGGSDVERLALAPGGIATFSAPNIHAKQGDILGLFVLPPGGSDLCVRTSSPEPGGVVVSAPDAFPPGMGQTISLSNPGGVGLDLNLSANVRPGLSSPPPLTKDQCKNGGRNAGEFKNQGDCISFVATGGKNRPSGP